MGTTGADMDYTNDDDPTTGLIPRAVKDMFLQLEQENKQAAGSMAWECRVSFLELYNEVSTPGSDREEALIPVRRNSSTCFQHPPYRVRRSPSARTRVK